MNVRRLIVYLILNAIVSAAATFTVLTVWDRTHPNTPDPAGLTLTATAPAVVLPNETQSAPVPAPTTAPPPTPTFYTVKSGDTLGTIAQQFDVSVEDIMAANGITNPNLLNVGQSLLIPVAGSVPPTAPPGTSAPQSTTVIEPPRPTATRDPSAALPRLTIREVRSAGVLAEEALVIINDGGPVDLDGWSLRDETGHSYIFPSLMLFEGGAVTVHTAAGTDSVTDLYWGQAEPVWASGVDALLSDAGGTLAARFTVP